MRLPLGPLLAILLMLTGPAMAQSPPHPVDPPAGTTGNPTRDGAAPPEVARPVRPASAADSPAARGGFVASLRPSLGLDRGWPGELFDFLAERDWTMLLLVLFNFLLALFAYRLWRSTVGLVEAAREQSRDLKQSIAATKDAADAARRGAEVAALQARVLIGVEQPRFELSSVQLEWADQSVRQALKAPSVDIAFTNHGRTSAFVTEKCIEARLTPTLPADPPGPGRRKYSLGLRLHQLPRLSRHEAQARLLPALGAAGPRGQHRRRVPAGRSRPLQLSNRGVAAIAGRARAGPSRRWLAPGPSRNDAGPTSEAATRCGEDAGGQAEPAWAKLMISSPR
jgi:hypothetical protein